MYCTEVGGVGGEGGKGGILTTYRVYVFLVHIVVEGFAVI